ncbi:hypothetical protein SUBVAR_04069 [Subdoligranulum variabile DSM 15176]|uniref:Uncharacterized protein n=1 Tax=Subdoligranulum variabile DSM 15176 TaxID=411471 RepID=D1PIA4_9FIRM|nr:hypothetical protein SUBVAR_04069 [Subdoligranulum variabile DSM 15176]
MFVFQYTIESSFCHYRKKGAVKKSSQKLTRQLPTAILEKL